MDQSIKPGCHIQWSVLQDRASRQGDRQAGRQEGMQAGRQASRQGSDACVTAACKDVTADCKNDS
eukprot:7957566-Alexandrium_andersonii.AAC.1